MCACAGMLVPVSVLRRELAKLARSLTPMQLSACWLVSAKAWPSFVVVVIVVVVVVVFLCSFAAVVDLSSGNSNNNNSSSNEWLK